MSTPDSLGATWYFDGSMLHGKWVQYRTTGFAIVVVHEGSLLGYGLGTPPHWCKTAAAAEAWALATVIRHSPIVPAMRTDCLSLLRTAENGTLSATQAGRQLARIWQAISHALDGDIQVLTNEGSLTWMPAHQTIAMIGEIMPAADWRANRLADAPAKTAAARRQLPKAMDRLLSSGVAAFRYAAGILAAATHRANNCMVATLDSNGQTVNTVMRDATVAPRKYGKRGAPEAARAPPAKVAKVFKVAPWKPTREPSAIAMHRKRERAASAECLQRRIAEIGQSLSVSATNVAVSERMRALMARVLRAGAPT